MSTARKRAIDRAAMTALLVDNPAWAAFNEAMIKAGLEGARGDTRARFPWR